MNLEQVFDIHFSLLQTADLFLRIIVSCAFGAIIGIERSRRFKEAGIRTHILVCCGAALFMIVSKYAFPEIASAEEGLFSGARGADPARVAAQVVSGISFLCSAVIIKNGGSVTGLTTAAGIWAAAGIGLAIGSGMYVVGILVTVAIASIQMLMHIVTVGADAYKHCNIDILVESLFNFDEKFRDLMKQYGATLVEFRITREVNGIRYNATLKSKKAITSDDVSAVLAGNAEVIEISVLSI